MLVLITLLFTLLVTNTPGPGLFFFYFSYRNLCSFYLILSKRILSVLIHRFFLSVIYMPNNRSNKLFLVCSLFFSVSPICNVKNEAHYNSFSEGFSHMVVGVRFWTTNILTNIHYLLILWSHHTQRSFFF